MFCLLSTARVLPGLPHQEGLRRDRAEHLSPQPRVRSHVLGEGEGGGGGRMCVHRRPRVRGRRGAAPHTLWMSHEPLHECSDRPVHSDKATLDQTNSGNVLTKRWLSPKEAHKVFTASRLIIVDTSLIFCVPRICTSNILTGLQYVINQHESCIDASLCIWVGFLLNVVGCSEEQEVLC